MEATTDIKNSADLRKFLMQTMLDVRYGHCKVDVAEAVADVAGQIHNSLTLELKVFKMMAAQGQERQKLGALPLTREEK